MQAFLQVPKTTDQTGLGRRAGVMGAACLIRHLAARSAAVGASGEAPQFLSGPQAAPTKPLVMVEGAVPFCLPCCVRFSECLNSRCSASTYLHPPSRLYII